MKQRFLVKTGFLSKIEKNTRILNISFTLKITMPLSNEERNYLLSIRFDTKDLIEKRTFDYGDNVTFSVEIAIIALAIYEKRARRIHNNAFIRQFLAERNL